MMSKFINPFTDVGFKRIFGQEISKPVLITFLNTLLEGEYCIANLKYLDKEQLGIADNDRSLIYDIYCELEDGGAYHSGDAEQEPAILQKPQHILYLAFHSHAGRARCRMGI